MRKWVVFIGCCLMCAVGFSIPNTVIAIFMQPLKETLHAPATSVMLYFTFYNIAAIPAAIFGQRVLKVNVAAVITVCAVICGLSLVLIGAFPSIPILWSASVLIGLSAPLANILSVPIIIPNWFKDSGTPIGVVMAFVGIGTAIIVPAAQGVMDSALG